MVSDKVRISTCRNVNKGLEAAAFKDVDTFESRLVGMKKKENKNANNPNSENVQTFQRKAVLCYRYS